MVILNLRIVGITMLAAVWVLLIIIKKISTLKIVENNINSFVYSFVYSSIVTVIISLTFFFLVAFKIDIKSNFFKSIFDSYLYLPVLMYIGGSVATYLSLKIKFDSCVKELRSIDKLNISSLIIISFIIVTIILGFELKDAMTLVTLLIGRIFWFDTDNENISKFLKEFIEGFPKKVIYPTHFISLVFIIVAILFRFSETSILVRSIGIGLYLSLFVSGGIGVYKGIKVKQ